MSYAAAGAMSLQLLSGYWQSENMKDAAELNQQIAEMNAEFAELDAFKAIQGGQADKARYQTVVDKTLSAQTANIAASDVDLSYGSIAEVQKETRFNAEMNKMEIDKQAQEQALGYKQQARDYRVSGATQRAAGDTAAGQALAAGVAGAASTYASNYKEVNSTVSSGYEKVKGIFN